MTEEEGTITKQHNNRVFSHDITVAILVSQNNETTSESFPQKGDAYYQIFPFIHEELKGESTSLSKVQGLQILLMSGVTVTSASQILESFWSIWSQVSDFPACGPGMYTLL